MKINLTSKSSRTIISLCLLLPLIYLVDIDEVVPLLGQTNLQFIGLYLLIQASNQLLALFKWAVSLRIFVRIPGLKKLAILHISSQLASLLTPLGVLGADAVRFGGLATQGTPLKRLVRPAIFEKFATLTMVSALFVVSSFWLKDLLPTETGLTLVTLLLFLFFALGSAICLDKSLAYRLKNLPLPIRVSAWIQDQLLDEDSSKFQKEKGYRFFDVISAFSLSLITVVASISNAYILMLALNISDIPFAHWLAIGNLMLVLTFMPFTLKGLGLKDGALVYIFSYYQIPLSQSLTFSLLEYSITTAFTTFLAALGYLFLGQSRDLPDQA